MQESRREPKCSKVELCLLDVTSRKRESRLIHRPTLTHFDTLHESECMCVSVTLCDCVAARPLLLLWLVCSITLACLRPPLFRLDSESLGRKNRVQLQLCCTCTLASLLAFPRTLTLCTCNAMNQAGTQGSTLQEPQTKDRRSTYCPNKHSLISTSSARKGCNKQRHKGQEVSSSHIVASCSQGNERARKS